MKRHRLSVLLSLFLCLLLSCASLAATKYKATNELAVGDTIPSQFAIVLAVSPADTRGSVTVTVHQTLVFNTGEVQESTVQKQMNQWSSLLVYTAPGDKPLTPEQNLPAFMDYTHRVYPLMLAAHDPAMPQFLFDLLHKLGYC